MWLLLPLLLLFLFPSRLSALQSKGHISCLCCWLSSLQAGSQTVCRMFLREWTWDQCLGSRGQGSRAGQREAEQRCPVTASASPTGALELELLSRVIPNGPFIPSNPSVVYLCCPGKGEILGEAAAYS